MDERDLHHVRRVEKIAGIEIHRYEEIPNHNVAGVLGDTGRLRPLFDAAVMRAARNP